MIGLCRLNEYIHYQHFYHLKCAMLLYGAGGNTVYVEISLDLNKAALYSETPEYPSIDCMVIEDNTS